MKSVVEDKAWIAMMDVPLEGRILVGSLQAILVNSEVVIAVNSNTLLNLAY